MSNPRQDMITHLPADTDEDIRHINEHISTMWLHPDRRALKVEKSVRLHGYKAIITLVPITDANHEEWWILRVYIPELLSDGRNPFSEYSSFNDAIEWEFIAVSISQFIRRMANAITAPDHRPDQPLHWDRLPAALDNLYRHRHFIHMLRVDWYNEMTIILDFERTQSTSAQWYVRMINQPLVRRNHDGGCRSDAFTLEGNEGLIALCLWIGRQAACMAEEYSAVIHQ